MYVAYRYQHHCRAALPAKTSAFNSLMQQNACHRYMYKVKRNGQKVANRKTQVAKSRNIKIWKHDFFCNLRFSGIIIFCNDLQK